MERMLAKQKGTKNGFAKYNPQKTKKKKNRINIGFVNEKVAILQVT
jgi:hypothetical protein